MITEKVTGIGHSRKVRPVKEEKINETDGAHGDDGRAGESSGNIVILTNKIRNAEKLKIRANGGSGEGGQHGGNGADGRNGVKMTTPLFLETILSYESLYWDGWARFKDYKPEPEWALENDNSVYKPFQQWIYREYKHTDGRQMTYCYTGDCGYIYNTYDIMFYIKGNDGTMGGAGGKNGISGEGGNPGVFIARCLKTGAELKQFKNVKMEKGAAGAEGKPGVAGEPGAHGNDMALVDRSAGKSVWSNRGSRYIYGESTRAKLQIQYNTKKSFDNALNGFRKHEERCSDCYVGFKTVEIGPMETTSPTEEKTSTERTGHSLPVDRETISVEKLLEEFAELCEGDEQKIGDISQFKGLEAGIGDQEVQHLLSETFAIMLPAVEDSQQKQEKILRRAVINADKDVDKKCSANQKLSCLEMLIDDVVTVDTELELKNDELVDVVETHKDPWWIKVDEEKNTRVQSFFTDFHYNAIDSLDLLVCFHDISKHLKIHKDVFAPFSHPSFNWANVSDVQKYMQTFLTPEEISRRENEEKDAEVEDEQEPLEEARDYSPIWLPKSKEVVGKAFKDVDQKVKQCEFLFYRLISLLKHDLALTRRFSIGTTSETKKFKQPGSSPESIVHLYYLTEQILNYNVRLIRYYLLYKKAITIPKDWYNPQAERMETIDDLINWARNNEMPKSYSDMRSFIQNYGIRCRAYRQMVADEQGTEIQVFFGSGFCKMRLVEDLLPKDRNGDNYELHRVIFKDDEMKSIVANEPLRKLRAIMKTCTQNVEPLSLNNNAISLDSYFPGAFKAEVCEWTDAIIAATGEHTVPRFFHRIFQRHGNTMSLVDFQFVVNTIIEANRNFDLPLEQLCYMMLTKDGYLCDIFLPLRVMAAMKERAPKFKDLIEQLSVIKNPYLRALFGSKLHEIPIAETVLASLVNMLAHAEDRMDQLENMHLKEWIDIANCQKWNSYEPLVKSYGNVGYYIVLLERIDKEKGKRLEHVIEVLKKNSKNEVFILEKIVSTLAFLIENNEIDFNDAYEKRLLSFLELVSQKYVKMREEIYAQLSSYNLREEDVQEEGSKTGNITYITNEILQGIMIDTFAVKEIQVWVWDAMFPEANRTLTDLIKLSVNPQDTDEAKIERKKEMETIKDILSDPTKDDIKEYGRTLDKIDTEFYNLYGYRLRHTQKIAILAAARSERNLLSQVNTGEGKTYLIACLAILRIFVDRNVTVDIITSSSVLAQRDAEAMKDLYAAFNIQVGHNCDEDVEKRQLAYKCEVVYGDIARFERDYLLQTFYKKNILGSRTRCNVIGDEIDVMLLDSGSNMLYLSHNVAGLELLDSLFVYLHKLVNMPSLGAADDDNFSTSKLKQKVLADMFGMVTKQDITELLVDRRNVASVEKLWKILVNQNVVNSDGLLQDNWVSS